MGEIGGAAWIGSWAASWQLPRAAGSLISDSSLWATSWQLPDFHSVVSARMHRNYAILHCSRIYIRVAHGVTLSRISPYAYTRGLDDLETRELVPEEVDTKITELRWQDVDINTLTDILQTYVCGVLLFFTTQYLV